MELLGIDFGTSRLRIATANNDTVGVSPHKYSSARLPFVIQSAAPFRITALKRILDFDSALPMPPSGISSMALLADIFRDVLGECCPTGLSDRYTVVAVPPCISQRQRSALRIVMTDLGLTRVRLVDDTLAALLATWELVRTYKTILVYSWGAGMFTAGMYRMKANSYHLVSQEGDRELGGDDFDAVLVDVIVAQLKKLGRDGAPNNADDLIHIVNVAERLKRLSPLENTMTVPLNRLLPGTSNGVADVTISTENLSAAIQRSTESTIALALKAIGDASESKPEAILAVGGMTCSPMVQEALRRHFGIPVIQASEHSVAIGTVLFGQLLPQSEWGTQRQAAGSQRNADLTAQTAAAPDSAAQTTVQAESRNGQEKWSDNFVP
ncbi:MAG: Hsp70 family protein, partial [Planctomycetota bacterium]|nr:Hsp70 family protein [Planctomycetota bacterium]